MKNLLFLLQAAATVLAVDLSIDTVALFPSGDPTDSPDIWQCATETLSQYFSAPTPTPTDLQEALIGYGASVWDESCTETELTDISDCPYPGAAQLCPFSTVAPAAIETPNIMTAYSSYASEVLDWWNERSDTISELVTLCPHGWATAVNRNYRGARWLDIGLAHAQCYAYATDGETVPTPVETTADPEETGTVPQVPATTTDDTSSGNARRSAGMETFVALGAAAVVTAFP